MRPIVSIIVPCYNQAIYLPLSLTSVLEQTYQNWECIIVNDGSPDNTKEVAKTWCSKDNRFIYVEKQNGGLSSARNAGIRKSKGLFIITLDADDMFEKTFIQKAKDILESNIAKGIVSCWGQKFYDIENKLDIFKPNGGNIKDFLFENSAIGNSMFRKECWEKVNGYDENMRKGYEDWEFYISVCKNGWEVEIIEEVLFYYRQHKTSMRTIAVCDHDTEIRSYIINKHKDLYNLYYLETIKYYLRKGNNFRNSLIKQQNKIDNKIGAVILKPLRFIKSIFR